MLGFDPRSFIVISTCLAALCGFLCHVLRRGIPSDIKGLTCWGNACAAMVLSSVLFALRGTIDILYSSFGANIAIIAGIVMMYCSIRQFCHRTPQIGLYLGVPLVMAVALIWPTFIDDSYRVRVIIVAAVNAVLFLASANVLRKCDVKRFPEYFTITVFTVTGLISGARCIAAISSSTTTTPLHDLSSVQYLYLATFAFSLVALSLGFILMIGKQLQLKLEVAALRDGLTGISTRSSFDETARAALAKSRRAGHASSMLMIDLDDFKAINDQHGHSGGDIVLKEFVRRVTAVLRSNDLFARYGGEEFVVFLPETADAASLDIANRICQAVQASSDAELPHFTASVGVATSQPETNDIGVLLEQADKALYRAKAAGKNRVEAFNAAPRAQMLEDAPAVSLAS